VHILDTIIAERCPMTDNAKHFREAVAERSKGRRGGGRYPRELRDVALQHLRQVRSKGGAAANAARDLGIDANTLRGWEKRRANGSPQTLSVLPVAFATERCETKAGTAQFVVHAPGGLRIECVNANAAAELVVALS
jgi:hypothetical protein